MSEVASPSKAANGAVQYPAVAEDPVVEAPTAVENGAVAASDPAPAAPAKEPAPTVDETPEAWRRRLWFVRYPPPGETKQEGFEDLNAKLESLKEQVKLLNASADVKRLERDSVQQLRRQARAVLNEVREKLRQKEEELKPLRDAREDQNTKRSSLRTAGNDLSVRSEQELDDRLREMHHQQQHSSLTVNEEKKLLQQIKVLESQRLKVREYGAMLQASQAAREAQQQMQGNFKALEADRRALAEERTLQQAIVDKYTSEQAGLDAQINGIFEERQRVKGLQDDAYEELKSARRDQGQKHGPYRANRWLSQQVRRVLRDGSLEEARAMCQQQTDETMQRMADDTDFRQEYVAQWAQARPKAEALDEPARRDPEKAQQLAAADREASKSRAEQVIAQALEQAKTSLAQSRSSGRLADQGGANGFATPGEDAPDTAAPGMPLPVRPPPPKPVPAARQSAAPAQPQGGSPGKAAALDKKISQLPPPPDEPFQVPTSLMPSAAPPSEEEIMAKLRAHNAAAVRDADARKDRQRAQQEKRRAKAARAKAQRQERAGQAQTTETEHESGPTAETTPVTTEDESGAASKQPAVPSADFLLSAAAEASAMGKRKSKNPRTAAKAERSEGAFKRARPPKARKGVMRYLQDSQPAWPIALAVALVLGVIGVVIYATSGSSSTASSSVR